MKKPGRFPRKSPRSPSHPKDTNRAPGGDDGRRGQNKNQTPESPSEFPAEKRTAFGYLDSIPDAVVEVGQTGTILFANLQILKLFGYKQDELQGHSIEILLPERFRKHHVRLRERYFAEPELRPMGAGLNLFGLRKDGTEVPVDIMLSPVRAIGAPTVLCTVRDLTEHLCAQAKVREANLRLQRAVHAGNVGLWDWDLTTNKVHFSPEWKSQIGYRDDEVGDRFEEWRDRVHPDDIAGALKAVDAYLKGGIPEYEVEFRFRHKDGSYRHILARGTKVLDEHGKPVRMLGSHVDITERTELQAQLLQSQKMEAVGQLAGGIAHDFNNLLTIILGYANLTLAGKDDPAAMRNTLALIEQTGKRAANLTRQLLQFSRRQVVNPEVLDLNGFLNSLKDMLGHLLGEQYEVQMDLSPHLQRIAVDPTQLEQVVFNLAVNARDAMPWGGRLTFETRNVDLEESYARSHSGVVSGAYVQLAVSDTGDGMDENTLAHIFEPFFTTKERGKGTGLGLSTVYGIVKQNNGHICVYSERGRGSVFKVHFPAVQGESKRPASSTLRPAIRKANATVLVVEDNPQVRTLASMILAGHGYHVIEAECGAEALKKAKDQADPIDLLLTDVIMPQMSGKELAVELAKMCPEVRTLYMSGYTSNLIEHHGILDEGASLIEKPFTPEALLRKVAEFLGSDLG